MQLTAFCLSGLWHNVVQSAIVTSADNDPAQESLVAEVVGARKLRRVGSTGNGELWKDLPFFQGVVFDVYLKDLMWFQKEHRLNLAAFTARLVAVDGDASNLVACALLMLRETLETQRPLTVTEDGRDTPVADLLPAVVAWFKLAGIWLLKSSLATEGSVMEDFLALGELAQQDRILAPGFSVERWHFWEKRLEQLSSVDDKEISEQALMGKEAMRKAWDEVSADEIFLGKGDYNSSY